MAEREDWRREKQETDAALVDLFRGLVTRAYRKGDAPALDHHKVLLDSGEEVGLLVISGMYKDEMYPQHITIASADDSFVLLANASWEDDNPIITGTDMAIKGGFTGVLEPPSEEGPKVITTSTTWYALSHDRIIEIITKLGVAYTQPDEYIGQEPL